VSAERDTPDSTEKVRDSLAAGGIHQGSRWCTWPRALPWLCSRIWSTCPGGISRTVNVCVAAVIPDIVSITTERDFRHRADLRELSPQALGDWWIETKESAVLEVASTVVPHEHNYLLNPAHPEFAQIATEPPALFHFDPRLFR
jgi:hypothetical protein